MRLLASLLPYTRPLAERRPRYRGRVVREHDVRPTRDRDCPPAQRALHAGHAQAPTPVTSQSFAHLGGAMHHSLHRHAVPEIAISDFDAAVRRPTDHLDAVVKARLDDRQTIRVRMFVPPVEEADVDREHPIGRTVRADENRCLRSRRAPVHRRRQVPTLHRRTTQRVRRPGGSARSARPDPHRGSRLARSHPERARQRIVGRADSVRSAIARSTALSVAGAMLRPWKITSAPRTLRRTARHEHRPNGTTPARRSTMRTPGPRSAPKPIALSSAHSPSGCSRTSSDRGPRVGRPIRYDVERRIMTRRDGGSAWCGGEARRGDPEARLPQASGSAAVDVIAPFDRSIDRVGV